MAELKFLNLHGGVTWDHQWLLYFGEESPTPKNKSQKTRISMPSTGTKDTKQIREAWLRWHQRKRETAPQRKWRNEEQAKEWERAKCMLVLLSTSIFACGFVHKYWCMHTYEYTGCQECQILHAGMKSGKHTLMPPCCWWSCRLDRLCTVPLCLTWNDSPDRLWTKGQEKE